MQQTKTLIKHLFQHYGLKGSLKELPGYDDKNYLLDCRDSEPSRRYLIKEAHWSTQKDWLELQNAVYFQLQGRKFGKCCVTQKIYPNHEGLLMTAREVDGKINWVRVLDFIQGEMLYDVKEVGEDVAAEVGRVVAQMTLDLRAISHLPEAVRDEQSDHCKHWVWNVSNYNMVYQKNLPYLSPELKPIIDKIREEFNAVEPELKQLPRWLIHQDICATNIIASRDKEGELQIAGVIDFGDLMCEYGIHELVISAARISMQPDKPLANLLALVAAYHKIKPLSPLQQKILFPLIKARLGQLTLNCCETCAQENATEYHLDNLRSCTEFMNIICNAATNQQFLEALQDKIKHE